MGWTRRVILTSSPNEDFFWAASSINFVIDAGLEKKYVSLSFFFMLQVFRVKFQGQDKII